MYLCMRVFVVGVDQLDKEGHLQALKSGPVFWIDSADSQPCVGTAGIVQWQLRCDGILFHSGLPHKAVNPIELLSGLFVCCFF